MNQILKGTSERPPFSKNHLLKFFSVHTITTKISLSMFSIIIIIALIPVVNKKREKRETPSLDPSLDFNTLTRLYILLKLVYVLNGFNQSLSSLAINLALLYAMSMVKQVLPR